MLDNNSFEESPDSPFIKSAYKSISVTPPTPPHHTQKYLQGCSLGNGR